MDVVCTPAPHLGGERPVGAAASPNRVHGLHSRGDSAEGDLDPETGLFLTANVGKWPRPNFGQMPVFCKWLPLEHSRVGSLTCVRGAFLHGRAELRVKDRARHSLSGQLQGVCVQT